MDPGLVLQHGYSVMYSRRGLVLIGRDKGIKRKPGEIRLLRESGLRVFRLASRRDLTTWGYLERLVRRWGEMEEIIRTRGPGPWFYGITEGGISERRI